MKSLFWCFHSFSLFIKFHSEVDKLKSILYKSSYPSDMVDKCITESLDKTLPPKTVVSTMSKKDLVIALPYLGKLSLQVHTKIICIIRPGQIGHLMLIGHAWVRRTSKMHLIFWVQTFCLVKRKKTDLHVFSQIDKNNHNVTVNSKYYHERYHTCNILIKFTYLMASKLLHLLMDCKIFN